MTALAANRATPFREGGVLELPVAAAKHIYQGSLVAIDASGNAEPGSTATGKLAAGRAEAEVDNSSGSAGDLSVRVRQGTFRWGNSTSTDEITAAEIGDQCYIVDDQTVAKTNGGSTRSVAGRVVDVDAQGVWVETDFNSIA